MVVDDPSSLLFPEVFVRISGITPRAEVALKLEGFNLTGSIKIKTASFLVADVEARRLAWPGETTLVESSSGNLGVALSFVCLRRGFRFACVTDPNTSKACIGAMRAYGAEVFVVDEPDETGGYLAARLARIQRLVSERPSHLWLNQYAASANATAHYETTAREILRSYPSPDYVVIGSGSGGTLAGCVRRLREESPRTRVIAVEPEGSVSFGGDAAPRRIPGIGASRRPELLDGAGVDRVVFVPEADTIRMCHELAMRTGLLLGGSTGAVLAGIRKMGDAIPAGAVVVAISADFGDKYLDTVYDRDWVFQHYGFDPKVLPDT
jgi:N-(2-amino-2-carboxyethyl)-L-glutamate synthase